MKRTPEEIKLRSNFEPGTLSKDGFLGEDDRHVHDIIEADEKTLLRLNVTNELIADRLQYFIEVGKKGLETAVDLGDYSVQVIWQRGMMPCPFGERGLHHKIIATVINKNMDRRIRYSQLNVHMIREHGFFEGRGGVFRLDPEVVVEVLGINP